MDEHHRIEREADEAFAAFRKKWPGNDAGDPTCVELWHHAWRAAMAAERERWESALGAVMPADFKDWHQNSAMERPAVAAWVIRNLRDREAYLEGVLADVQDGA